MVFSEEPGSKKTRFQRNPTQPRATWQSATHFVSVTVFDGVLRGPASAELWKEPKE